MTKSKMGLSLEKVAQKLDGVGITWTVFAGAAATVYGVTRPLTDVDILVPAAEGARTAALFPEAQVEHRQDGTIGWIKLPDFDILAGLTVMDLDDQMAARLTRHEIAGVTVPVIPPEDNILLKASWGRGAEVGKHDWEDVEAMMAYLPSLDWEYLRWRAETCVSKERREQVLARLEIMWNQLRNT
jgi:hypothetical protein